MSPFHFYSIVHINIRHRSHALGIHAYRQARRRSLNVTPIPDDSCFLQRSQSRTLRKWKGERRERLRHWKVDSYSTGQEIPCAYGIWMFISAFIKPTAWLQPSQFILVHNSTTYFSKIHIDIYFHPSLGLPYGLFSRSHDQMFLVFTIYLMHDKRRTSWINQYPLRSTILCLEHLRGQHIMPSIGRLAGKFCVSEILVFTARSQ
jgi:hypothetical protein